jgi:hypothetical protein
MEKARAGDLRGRDPQLNHFRKSKARASSTAGVTAPLSYRTLATRAAEISPQHTAKSDGGGPRLYRGISPMMNEVIWRLGAKSGIHCLIMIRPFSAALKPSLILSLSDLSLMPIFARIAFRDHLGISKENQEV